MCASSNWWPNVIISSLNDELCVIQSTTESHHQLMLRCIIDGGHLRVLEKHCYWLYSTLRQSRGVPLTTGYPMFRLAPCWMPLNFITNPTVQVFNRWRPVSRVDVSIWWCCSAISSFSIADILLGWPQPLFFQSWFFKTPSNFEVVLYIWTRWINAIMQCSLWVQIYFFIICLQTVWWISLTCVV